MQVKGEALSTRVAAALLGTCLLPIAFAMSSTGHLSVDSMAFPPATGAEGPFLGLIYNDAANLSTGDLRSEEVILCKYETRFVEISHEEPLARLPMNIDVQEACFPQTAVALTLNRGAGWIGARPRSGGSVSTTTSGPTDAEPRTFSDLATENSDVVASDDDRKPRFTHVLSQEHIFISTSGVVEYLGDGELRFMGPTALVEASENTTTYQTGIEKRGGTPSAHETIVRWIVIRYEAASLRLDTSSPLSFAVESARIEWNGNATARGVHGFLHVDGQTYAPKSAGGSAYVDGTFTSSLIPEQGGEVALLKLEGDLRGTSLRPTFRAAIPAEQSPSPWIPLILGAAVIGAGAGTIMALRRRHATYAKPERGNSPFRGESRNGLYSHLAGLRSEQARSYEERADCLADGRCWLQAADLFRKVRRLDPARPKVAMKEGIALYHAGNVRLALFSFLDAALLEDDGEAEVWAARCHLRLNEIDAAEVVFLKGLSRYPTRETLDVMETHDELAILRNSLAVRTALDGAWDRAGT